MASLSPLTGALGHRRAAHLLRRTGFRFTKTKVDQMAGQTAGEALNSLLALYPFQQDQPLYDDQSTTGVAEHFAWINPPGLVPGWTTPPQDFQLRPFVVGWWINEALHDPGVGHKMTFFLHQHMVVTSNSLLSTHFFDYLALLRWGALGNFKKLALKIVTDNCMLRYLNNNENTAANPNENFAREFFELFTIGKGPQIGPGDYTNYTEDDIVQAARVLTGFRTRINRNVIDAETGLPRGDVAYNQHAQGSKTFSSKFQGAVIPGATDAFGMWTELNAFVDMVFAQPETARNFCRRLYRFFIHRNISTEIENDIIVPLANAFQTGGFEIKPVLEQLLRSKQFYDADDSANSDEIVGGMIKSPLELALQSLSFFNIAIPDPVAEPAKHYFTFYNQAVVNRMFGGASLPLFAPSDVAGYPAYYQEPDFSRQWFNSSTVIARYKLPAMLLTGTRQFGQGNPNTPIGIKLDIAPWVRDSGVISDAADPYVLVQDLISYLLPEPPSTDRFDYFYIQTFLDSLPPADWTYEWQNYLTTNDDGEVKIALERLIKAIMYSPEYQTF